METQGVQVTLLSPPGPRLEARTTVAGHSCPTCDREQPREVPWRLWGSSRNVSLLSISTKMVLHSLAEDDSLGWENPEPTTCASRA